MNGKWKGKLLMKSEYCSMKFLEIKLLQLSVKWKYLILVLCPLIETFFQLVFAKYFQQWNNSRNGSAIESQWPFLGVCYRLVDWNSSDLFNSWLTNIKQQMFLAHNWFHRHIRLDCWQVSDDSRLFSVYSVGIRAGTH